MSWKTMGITALIALGVVWATNNVNAIGSLVAKK